MFTSCVALAPLFIFAPNTPTLTLNSYSAEWTTEAAARGLPNLRNTVEALATFDSDKNRALFAAMKVLSADELASRSDIMYHTYTHQVLYFGRGGLQ